MAELLINKLMAELNVKQLIQQAVNDVADTKITEQPQTQQQNSKRHGDKERGLKSSKLDQDKIENETQNYPKQEQTRSPGCVESGDNEIKSVTW